jgi:glycosyltransferase involved in cell wall biosynthesis
VTTRVLLWYWGRHGGGVSYTWHLARALAAAPGLEVSLSLSRQNEAWERFAALGLPIHAVDTYSGRISALLAIARIPFVARWFRNLIRRERIDCVLGTMSHLWNPLMLGAVRAGGARLVLVVHDASAHPGEDFGIRSWMLRREVAAADRVIALSRHVARQLSELHRYPPERIHESELGNSLMDSVFAAPRRFPEGRKFRLLFFGRLLPYKGIDLLVEAYQRLRPRHPEVVLRVIGPGKPPKSLSGELPPDVSLEAGWIPDERIPGILAEADLLVLPYIEASQSGVVGMAAAAALPTVATPVGGLPEQVIDGETGIVAEAVSAEAVAAAIERLLTDRALYRQCSEGAVRRARAAQPNGRAMATLLHEICGKGAR